MSDQIPNTQPRGGFNPAPKPDLIEHEEEKEEQESESFLDHLEVLRWHIMRSVVAILVFSIGAFFAKSFIFEEILFGPKQHDFLTNRVFCKLSHLLQMGDQLCFPELKLSIVNLEITGQFLMHLKVSFLTGFIVAFPYIIWEFWRFIKPGLYTNERKYARGLVFFCSILFFTGVCFGYFIITPFSVNFLGSYSITDQIQNSISVTSYISFISSIVLAAGLMFEMPMVVYFLAKLGLIDGNFLKAYRKHSLVIILLLSGIITPPDVASQIILTLPLYFLYELSIVIANRVTKNNEEND